MNVPAFFMALAGVLLVLALYALWRSLRVAFGVPTEVSGGVFAGGSVATDRAALVDEKNALLRSLKDLDYEREVGKIEEADYERLKQRYRRRAKEILRLLDQDIEPYLKEASALIDAHLRGDEQEGESKKRRPKKSPKKKRRKKKKAEDTEDTEEAAAEEPGDEEDSVESPEDEEDSVEEPEDEEDSVESGEEGEDEEGDDEESGEQICPSCETVNDPDARFCKSCAHDFQAEEVAHA